jgi:hypothetical protein
MTALNNITTADDYTDATTVAAHASTRLRLFVRNAAVYRQLARGGTAGALVWEEGIDGEMFTPPGNFSFDETDNPFDGARVRSAVPGAPAQVTLQATP